MRKRTVLLLGASWVLSSTLASAQVAAPDAGAAPKPPAAKPPAPPAAKPPAPPAAKPPAPAAKPPAPPAAKPPAPPAAKPGAPGKPPVKPAGPDEPEVAAEEEPSEEEPSEETPKPPVTGKGPRTGGVTPVPGGTGFGPMPLWPQPGSDAKALEKQGDKTPDAAQKQKDKDEVFAEDWWSHARPIFEIHGYFRVRAELFHNFSLGRVDTPSSAIWPIPADNNYNAHSGSAGGNSIGPALCTGEESPESNSNSDNPRDGLWPCKNKSQAGANMRFRLNPELHISDNLRIMSQIDLLDNLVLGSTPDGYANEPADGGGYSVVKRTGYTPLGAFDGTQNPPSAGQNSYRDSIRVKRVWAEYMTPVGQLRFGRMPSQWGLGILANAGDGLDDDYQSTSDRIMFVSGIKSLDIYFAGAWDFVNEGPTSDTLKLQQAQPYDLGQLDDVDQYVFVAMRRKNPELTKFALAQGQLVLNGGAYVVHRRQILANDTALGCGANSAALGCAQDTVSAGYVRRGATAWIPDFWVQLLYKKFRFELEAVAIRGTIENLSTSPVQGSDYENPNGEDGWKIRQYGIAAEIEQKLVEDRLKLEFMTGWASGDGDTQRLDGTNNLSPGLNGLQPQGGDRTISTFRFHPNYRVDLILNRNLLTRVQGVYYFRPSVDYDFVREANGQRFGGGFAGIWTRASQFVQTPGHKRDLGIELNLSLYYQSKDGALNDNNEKAGGFYTMLQYGVLFPMGGLGYQEQEQIRIQQDLQDSGATDTTTAQVLRLYMGVLF